MSIERKSRPGLRLWQSGLLIICSLLIFEIVFVFTLINLLRQAENDIRAEYHARLVLLESSALTKCLYEAGTIVMAQASGHVAPSDQGFLRAITQSRQSVALLQDLTSKDVFERESMRRITLLANQAIEVLVDARLHLTNSADGLYLDSTTDIRHRAEEIMSQLVSELTNLREWEARQRSTNPDAAARSRHSVELWLMCGLAINVIGAIFTVLFFSRKFVHRVGVIADNSARLIESRTLLPRLSGGDEIADLDAVFHDMAEALIEAAKKERALTEHATAVICSIDSSGHFTKVNPACLRVWLYSPEELLGKPWLELVPDTARDAVSQIVEGLKGSTDCEASFECSMIKKDGSILHALWSCSWSTNDRTIFCVVSDITARKQIEEMKQQFTDMISHELRTPLTSIQAVLQLLSLGALGRLPEKASKNIHSAQRSCSRLITLINELLDVEKLESGQMQMEFAETSLTSVIEPSVEAVANLAENKNLKIEVTSANDLSVYGDQHRLIQVMVNLLSNAIKFSPSGGRIQIHCRNEQPDDQVLVVVQDEGRGVPEHLREAIFERFRQVQISDGSHAGGSGLGLAICKAIVEQHGGSIGVDGSSSGGSAFWFKLPVRAAVHADANAKDKNAAESLPGA